MTTERVQRVIDIVREAGDIALRYYGKTEPTRKADRSLVTQGDVEVGNFLESRLSLNFPGYGIVNEETVDLPNKVKGEGKYTWIIDPIDGTAGYSKRMPVWGVAVGLMKGPEPILGVFYMPVLDELYFTDEGIDAFFETKRWGRTKMNLNQCSGPIEKESLLLSVSYAHRRLNVVFPGKVRSLGSALAHICYVARGDATAAIIKGHIWDIVPGWSILKKAGGVAMYMDGATPDLTMMLDGRIAPDFILASCPSHAQEILGNITKKDPV